MWALAAALKPFVLLLLAALVLNPAKRAVIRYWPEGRVKRALLFRVSDAESYRSRPRGGSLRDL